ncbi:MAG: hypothetical protein MZV64_39145 [Ignavibacteriales bacterium]|nr:hypothetical protein [Ignavibacteriales bacterium]
MQTIHFNIGAKEFTTMREDYQAVLGLCWITERRLKDCLKNQLYYTLKFLEAMKLSPLYKWVYETASKDSFVSIEKAEKVLGYKPKFSNKDALIRNYKWYVEHHEMNSKTKTVFHIRVPWKQGILKVCKNFLLTSGM